MPDRRRHRGAHPEDAELFSAAARPALRAAAADLAWLLGRGYASPSSLKLVGDRYQLRERQRRALGRAVCPGDRLADRRGRALSPAAVADRELLIDGFNLLTTIEVALGGGVVLRCQDGTLRDIASVHGTYRAVQETAAAIELVGRTLAALAPREARWYLDRPVSNSGRLRGRLAAAAAAAGWPWQVELVPDPDRVLIDGAGVAVTADSAVLDRCGPWLGLASLVIEAEVPGAWIVDLRPGDPAGI